MTEAEYKWIVLQAGDVPLSKWCHRKLLKEQKIEISDRVPELRKRGKVRATIGREPAADGTVEREYPATHECVNCEHGKSKHGGFGDACQSDNCLCGGFE